MAANSGVSHGGTAEHQSTQIIVFNYLLAVWRILAKCREMALAVLLISGSQVRILHGSPLSH
jgi:hypothetical protein